MATSTLARPIASVFPEEVARGAFLKLKARDGDFHIIVEAIGGSIPGIYTVLSFDSAQEHDLVVRDCRMERGEGTPPFWFLRADIATPEEVAAYIEKRRAEIGRSLARLEALQSRFEERVGKRLPPPD